MTKKKKGRRKRNPLHLALQFAGNLMNKDFQSLLHP